MRGAAAVAAVEATVVEGKELLVRRDSGQGQKAQATVVEASWHSTLDARLFAWHQYKY